MLMMDIDGFKQELLKKNIYTALNWHIDTIVWTTSTLECQLWQMCWRDINAYYYYNHVISFQTIVESRSILIWPKIIQAKVIEWCGYRRNTPQL